MATLIAQGERRHVVVMGAGPAGLTAAYELLKRVAAQAGDEQTVLMTDEVLFEERAAAGRVQSLFDQALEASLQEAGVKA